MRHLIREYIESRKQLTRNLKVITAIVEKITKEMADDGNDHANVVI